MRFSELPLTFREHMKELLGEEVEAYAASFEDRRLYGLRINTWKTEADRFLERLPFSLKPVPWTENGFYYEENDRPSKEPFYYGGLYYLQEPSAMAPAALLPVKPGDRVLDLCGAPGGKSTELGARLKGRGILFSNDISHSRAKALLKNLELFGIPNICVTSEEPKKLAELMPEFFDAVLVDAPCSGEGMFRKDDKMVKDWLEKGPEYYAPVQKEIIKQAASLLKPGGYLLYSTCTFSKEEDEDVVRDLLEAREDMELVKLPLWEGASEGIGLKGCVRLFPHRIRGEGHFIALLRKKAGTGAKDGNSGKGPDCFRKKAALPERRKEKIPQEAEIFLKDVQAPYMEKGQIHRIQDSIYLLPEDFPNKARLRYLRTGLLLGTLKKGRFEPSQALAMALKKEEYPVSISLNREDQRVIRYLKGETISLAPEEGAGKKGWCLICIEEFPLGWGKISSNMVKNKYYPGWRWQ